MIALVQRVARAQVDVGGVAAGRIDRGLLVFVCAEPSDDEALCDRFVAKLLGLRIFGGADGRMNRSVVDVNGGLLIVSQFTLAADVRGGNRPSFSGAAPAELGRRLYERVLASARTQHAPVEAGVFGAEMQVSLVNDGPVTIPIVLRSAARRAAECGPGLRPARARHR